MNVIESLIKLNISEECFDSILEKCFDTFINETDEKSVQGLVAGRQKNYDDNPSSNNKYKLARTMIAVGDWERRKAKKHLEELKKEADEERTGEAERRRKVQTLKDTYKYGDSKKAGEEHDNAMINQYNKNKLENSLKK